MIPEAPAAILERFGEDDQHGRAPKKVMGVPQKRWMVFVNGKIPIYKWMRTGGSRILGKPHMLQWPDQDAVLCCSIWMHLGQALWSQTKPPFFHIAIPMSPKCSSPTFCPRGYPPQPHKRATGLQCCCLGHSVSWNPFFGCVQTSERPILTAKNCNRPSRDQTWQSKILYKPLCMEVLTGNYLQMREFHCHVWLPRVNGE